MKSSVIHQLNQLNQTFYQTIATSFDQTRQQAWEGWIQLIPELTTLHKNQPLSVLDVGCGNARFGTFLAKTFSNKPREIEYVGTDSNETLITLAKQRLDETHLAFSLWQIDLVETLLKQDLNFESLPFKPFSLITLFGVLHHIPSFQLRQKLLTQLASVLKPCGLLIITTWNFTKNPQLMARAVTPETLGLSAVDLEPGDYLLDWQRGTPAVRYCHATSQTELEQLCPPELSQIIQFEADGKTGDLNTYTIWQKE